ncbi:MAG: C39 family peptidase [Chlamydiota bacterium]
MIYIAILCSLFLPLQLFPAMFHHILDHLEEQATTYQWEQPSDTPFDELIISWYADRPSNGHYAIYASIKVDENWSPWLPYALWGTDFQQTFDSGNDFFIRSYQDVVSVGEGKKGSAFRIQIRAEDGASLNDFHRLHVSATDLSQFSPDLPTFICEKSVSRFPVPLISQMALSDPRNKRLCSPTSATALVNFYNKDTASNAIDFAEKVYDKRWNIFGNWVFNVAQASLLLGKNYICYVERIENLTDIFSHIPVVISIKADLPNGAVPYSKSGHLLVVAGYDNDRQSFNCMDPAFQTNQDTAVDYQAVDLLPAWNCSKRIAYVIFPCSDPDKWCASHTASR